MFEIGSSLREARMRQKLELSQIERDTRIRAKYLEALEEERFELLPGLAYAKGFLHTYAEIRILRSRRPLAPQRTTIGQRPGRVFDPTFQRQVMRPPVFGPSPLSFETVLS